MIDPVVEQVVAPNFDLSDAGKEADHGQVAEPQAAAAATVSPTASAGDGSTEAQVFQAEGLTIPMPRPTRS